MLSVLIMQKDNSADIKRITIIGLIVNLLLTLFKFIAGIIGTSQAVVADAVHSLSDCSTDIVILIGVRYWSKPADREHPHGHGRLETLVTVIIAAVLGFVGIGICIKAISTLHFVHSEGPRLIALFAALFSIVSKEFLYRWTAAVGVRIKSSSVVANAWHHRSDALSSIPAAIAVAGTLINPRLIYLDHIGAILVSAFILRATWKILAPALAELLDQGAPEEVLTRIKEITMNTPGVLFTHALRSRYIGSGGLQVDLHIKVDGEISVRAGHDISENVKQRLIENCKDVVDVVVHTEPMNN